MKPWETRSIEPADPKMIEVAGRLEVLNTDNSRLVEKVIKGLREGFIDSIKILYWAEMDKFRSRPDIMEIIEREVIGDAEVRKTLGRGAGEFGLRKKK